MLTINYLIENFKRKNKNLKAKIQINLHVAQILKDSFVPPDICMWFISTIEQPFKTSNKSIHLQAHNICLIETLTFRMVVNLF